MQLSIISKENDAPVPFATVTGYDINGNVVRRTTSTSEGLVSFSEPEWRNAGVTGLNITSVGYSGLSFPISDISDGSVIRMNKDVVGLEEVIVDGVKKSGKTIIWILLALVIISIGTYAIIKVSKKN